MKPDDKAAKRLAAQATLANLHIDVGQDFYTLRLSQQDALLAEADRVRYQRPRNANGSRGRYFHEYLQRLASMQD